MSEAKEQSNLISWADECVRLNIYPELKYLYHIPNGGSRNTAEARNLKRQGVRPGVPDLCLPVPRGRYHGVYIEMKVGKNVPTSNQKEWLSGLRSLGYLTAVCYSAADARRLIEYYLTEEQE